MPVTCRLVDLDGSLGDEPEIVARSGFARIVGVAKVVDDDDARRRVHEHLAVDDAAHMQGDVFAADEVERLVPEQVALARGRRPRAAALRSCRQCGR